jgi:acetylglutamate kinase
MSACAAEGSVAQVQANAAGDGKAFARDITLLETSGVRPVVVHGGGPQIGQMLEQLGIKSEFRGGLRVTDKRTVEVVEMVLAGSINKEIVMAINAEGGKAVGLSGKDGNMVFAEKVTRHEIDPDSNIEREIDLGLVGEPKKVNRAVIDMLLGAELIPVIAPVAPGVNGETYNVNADTFAGAIAGALAATRLLFLTDVPGVLDKQGNLLKELTVKRVMALIADGTIPGEQQHVLLAIGRWLDVNGDAIYDTRPWKISEEGKIHFTTRGDTLYLISLPWLAGELVIPALGEGRGHAGELEFTRDAVGLHVKFPLEKPCDFAYSLRISVR